MRHAPKHPTTKLPAYMEAPRTSDEEEDDPRGGYCGTHKAVELRKRELEKEVDHLYLEYILEHASAVPNKLNRRVHSGANEEKGMIWAGCHCEDRLDRGLAVGIVDYKDGRQVVAYGALHDGDRIVSSGSLKIEQKFAAFDDAKAKEKAMAELGI